MADPVSKAAAAWQVEQRKRARGWVKKSLNPNQKKWETAINDVDSVIQFPAWEIILIGADPGRLNEWHGRWKSCGGIFFGSRMIAGKRDELWQRLGRAFPDGTGKPYPPFSESNRATWSAISNEECCALGVVLDVTTMGFIKGAANGEILFDTTKATLDDWRAARDALSAAIEKLRNKP